MAAFRFTGRDAQGQKVSGVRQAASAEALAGELLAERITPLTIEAQAESAVGGDTDVLRQLRRLLGRERVSLEELIIFCRQMHSLSKAGVPILRAMGGLADSTRNPFFGEVLRAVRADLEAGNGLGVALSSHPRVFTPLFISMVSVGENTGQLDLAFKQLAGYLDMERETRKRIQQATRYPLFVLLAMGVALVVINLLVIPAFSKVFAQFKSELPLPTRILIGFSEFTQQWWWLIALALAGGLVLLLRWLQTEPGARLWDRYKLRLPIVGGIFERIALARFTRTFAMM